MFSAALFLGVKLESSRVIVTSCRGLVPQVPRATGYGPKNLDTTQFPLVANGWGTKYPVPNMAPPLLDEEEVSPT
jgi:hypothetical protein